MVDMEEDMDMVDHHIMAAAGITDRRIIMDRRTIITDRVDPAACAAQYPKTWSSL
ncbi:Hypothetical predicted protein [Drosophila guanche]|uniref:Uncharacterized protein n=1 Tax=Drosophila guanche TaxID=7266 RepID=A0A3B0JPE8_DROGU|nr:Hypothetical predicted protein [Drosophila guanche]